MITALLCYAREFPDVLDMNSGRRRSSHDIKRSVFKNNYSRLREGFNSAGCSIKGFLYSKDVINTETRDSPDMNKVLACVEVKLKFSEATWDILMTGMSEPPLDSLCSDLQEELERLSSLVPPTSLQIQSEGSSDTPTEDSGCAGSTSINKEYSNYPLNHFPQPLNTPVLSEGPSPVNLIHETSPGLSGATSQNSIVSVTSNLPLSAPQIETLVSPPESKDTADGVEPADIHSSQDTSQPQKSSSEDSGYNSLSAKYPTDSAATPVTVSHPVGSNSELVQAQQSRSHLIDCEIPSSTEILRQRIANLERENNNLRITKKQVIDQIKELEEDNNYLLKEWKDDQQLLEFKLQQVARENEILERKQENIRRLRDDNIQLKKELKESLIQQQLLLEAIENLKCRIQLAERSTSLSAITIDHLKQDIVDRDNIIDDLRKELSRYRDWYTALSESDNKSKDSYLSLPRTENS